MKCAEFSKLLPELDSKGAGLQAPHEEGKLTMKHKHMYFKIKNL